MLEKFPVQLLQNRWEQKGNGWKTETIEKEIIVIKWRRKKLTIMGIFIFFVRFEKYRKKTNKLIKNVIWNKMIRGEKWAFCSAELQEKRVFLREEVDAGFLRLIDAFLQKVLLQRHAAIRDDVMPPTNWLQGKQRHSLIHAFMHSFTSNADKQTPRDLKRNLHYFSTLILINLLSGKTQQKSWNKSKHLFGKMSLKI